MTDAAVPSPDDAQAEIARLRERLAAASAENERLTYELGHRVKNTLGVVQALAGQTLRTAATPQDAVDTLNLRIIALARANDAILKDGWTTAEIGAVARRVLVEGPATSGPLDIEGPAVRIAAGAALSFAMALHELATNARRHGAWNESRGSVMLTWRIEPGPEGERLVLLWAERGGSSATPPEKRGFGLRLVEQSLRSAFGRDVTFSFEPSGFSCRVLAALAAIQRER